MSIESQKFTKKGLECHNHLFVVVAAAVVPFIHSMWSKLKGVRIRLVV